MLPDDIWFTRLIGWIYGVTWRPAPPPDATCATIQSAGDRGPVWPSQWMMKRDVMRMRPDKLSDAQRGKRQIQRGKSRKAGHTLEADDAT